MKRTRAALIALFTAAMLIVATNAYADDDWLYLFCIAMGPEYPLYDILGCPDIVRAHQSPQG